MPGRAHIVGKTSSVATILVTSTLGTIIIFPSIEFGDHAHICLAIVAGLIVYEAISFRNDVV